MARLSGSIVALVTPFNNDKEQSVNYSKIAELVGFHAKNGTSAIVPCGTTGEAPTLSKEEWERVVATTVQSARGTVLRVIAGTGSYSTAETVRMTAHAAELGADACLVVTPYYNKPTPDCLIRHFKEINQVGIPIVLYNAPGRTGINVTPETTMRICEACEHLVAIKAANGNIDEITDLANRLSSFGRPVSILSGDDAITLPIMSVGGLGVISVAANIIPSVMNELVESYLRGDANRAMAITLATYNLGSSLLKLGVNPMAIKSLMNRAGMNVGPLRMPLSEIATEQLDKLVMTVREMKPALTKAGVEFDQIIAPL